MGLKYTRSLSVLCDRVVVSYPLKPGSQYNDVTLRQEVIQFSMGLVAGIEIISIPATVAATNPLKISCRNVTLSFCDPGFRCNEVANWSLLRGER